MVSYQWLWNIPDGNQWNQSNFRHIFQLKAVNAQASNTLPGGNSGGENGAYILAMSISGTTNRNLVVNHNRYDGDKNLMTIPLKEIDGHWIKVELTALISDTGWLTVKITDTVTGKVYTFDSPDVYQVFANQGAGDGVKDLWRRPERSGGFETEYPAAFDQYLRPKWGIYRSSNGGTNSAYDVQLKLSDITISKLASGVSAVNLALNKKAYNVGPTAGANPIQLQSAMANEYGNANKLTSAVLQDPTKWNVTNVTSLDQIGNYSWLGTDGARKGSFVIDLGRAMDFSQIRLFAKSTRLKGVTVYVSDDFGNHASAAEFDAMTFRQVDKKTAQGYTYATGNDNGGTDSDDSSYPIDLGKTYHSRYIKVTVENASGGNTGTDLTGPPRLTQVQVFNAPAPPQNLKVETGGSAQILKWDANNASEGYSVYNGTTVLADLPGSATSYTFTDNVTDLSKIAVRSKGTDPYSRKYMISAPALLADSQVPVDKKPKLMSLKVDGTDIPGFSPDVTGYKYILNPTAATLPAITAAAAAGFTVKAITYPNHYKTDPATIVVVSDSDENLSTTYTVMFALPAGEPLTFPLQDLFNAGLYTKNSAVALSGAGGAGTQAEWPASVTGYAQLNGNTAINDYVAFTLKSVPSGTYTVRFGFKTNNNRAILQLSADGNNLGGPIDEYASAQTYPIQNVGNITFASAGDHEFKFTVTGKNAASSSQTATFSFIQLVPQAGTESIFVESLSLNKSSVTINNGASGQLIATVLPDQATNKTVTWKSSDSSIAAVDQNGVVTGIKEGHATITATIGRFTMECTVTVTQTSKADASIVYTGPLSATGSNLTLSAVIREQNPGGPGMPSGLPVTFDVKKLQVGGVMIPYRTGSVTTNVYGQASLAVDLPAGLYEVSAALGANPYYNESAAKSILAVNAAGNGSLQVNGHIDAPVPPGIFGAKANKIHIESKWELLNGKATGSATIHAEPQGLRLEMKQTDWMITAGTSAYVQGRAFNEQGAEYTVRLMMDTAQGKSGKSSVLSIVVWKGAASEGTPVAEIGAQDFNGSIQIC